MKKLLPRLLIPAAILVAAIWLAYPPAMPRSEAIPQVDYVLLDGAQRDSSAWAGKVMLVNFWAPSCAPCVQEMPQLAATHEKFRQRGFDTLAVATRYDPPALVADFAASRRLPFGVAIDDTGRIAERFGHVEVTPTSFLINRRGEIVKRFVGELDFVVLHALVESLLSEA